MIFPAKVAQHWIDAWNAADLERLLSFYSESVQLRSPFAKVYSSDGSVRGKDALRGYWGEVMRRLPNLKLELVQVYSGHKAMSLHYRDDIGRNVIETMLFDDQDMIEFEAACFDRPR